MQVSQEMGWVLGRVGDFAACLGLCCRNWASLPWMRMVFFTVCACIAPQLHKQTCECSVSHLQDEGFLLGSANRGLSGSHYFVTQGQRIPQDFTAILVTKKKAPPWNIFCLLLFWVCVHYRLQKSPVLLCLARFYLSLVNTCIASTFSPHTWRMLSQN